MLDVETTSENNPQIVSMEAALYRLRDHEQLALVAEMTSIVKPSRGYSVLHHIQDLRYHGVTAEMMADHGDDASEALGSMLKMVRDGTGKASLADKDGAVVVVVAHGTQGMVSNMLAAAHVDESLHQYWDELDALCQRTDDTLPMYIRELSPTKRCTLEWALAAMGTPLPTSRVRALAILYARLRNLKLTTDEW